MQSRLTYVPVCQELVHHVKRLDGFKDEEIAKLKTLLFSLVKREEFNKEQTQEALMLTLKVNQMLALVDFSLEDGLSNKEKALKDILEALGKHRGLDYVPKEQTPQGRLFEHASECRSLLNHLQSVPLSEEVEGVKADSIYYVKLEGTEESTTHDERTLFTLRRDFIVLALQANGKAELYFHANFWIQAITSFCNAGASTEEAVDKLVASHVEVKRLKNLADFLSKVNANIGKHAFTQDIYEKYVALFGTPSAPKKSHQRHLEDLQKAIIYALIQDDQESLAWIEKILVQLLGYSDIHVRDQAVIFLNILYDGLDWQLTSAFRPTVRVVGQHFKVNLVVDLDLAKNKDAQIFIGLSAPCPFQGINKTVLTWHKIDQRNIVSSKGFETEISINFGKFWKCGFYDWRLVTVTENGRLQPLNMLALQSNNLSSQIKQSWSPDYYSEHHEADLSNQLAQGRFIVHAKGIRDHIFHEVYMDYQGAEIDTKENRFVKRGDFGKLERALDQYKKRGITALYLMGVLERDNNPYFNHSLGEVQFRKPDATPLAVTCRETVNKMLGGEEGFKKVMKKAKETKMKIITDSLTRISSSRNHRKYRDLMLHYLDEDGKKKICYGTDGQSINYEDTAILNYRKVESWNLLIDEMISFAEKHGTDGIHLDNGQAWPQILEIDAEELTRLDVDGLPAYTAADLLNGEIVIRNENCGYWNTNRMETYANPFFIKMCRRLWETLPDFMVVGECWGGFKFENRQIIMARSGIIPRMFKLPQAICQIFGKTLYKDGRVVTREKDSVKAINQWYELNKSAYLPEGSILLQSSSAHQWPYPAYLYGKGTWAAVDILYFMPDVPITFMGEIDGEVYRIEQTQVFQHEMQEAKGSSGLKRTNSQLMMMLQNQETRDEETTVITISSKSDITSPTSQKKSSLHRVRSGSSLAAVIVEQTQGQDLKFKEEKFKAEIGPQLGYDLSKIGSHYESRRRMRRDKMVLRYGEYVPLIARNDRDVEERVFAFARYSLQETAIIAINLSDQEVPFYIDLTPLKKIFLESYASNSVVMLTDWIQTEDHPQYFFLKELITLKQQVRLRGYKSQVLGFTICAQESDSFVVKKALTQSLERTKLKLQSGQSIESEQISLLFTDILEKSPRDIVTFANVIGSLQENFLDKMSGLQFYDLFYNNHLLKKIPELSSRLVALCKRIVEISEDTVCPPLKAALSIISSNKLGPIVFCTPELGRWSTVGGLGVMVDELAYGLSLLGEEVWVISPYYERNRKGETGYLAKDPAGIEYKENITVTLNNKYVLGVHEGEVHGVKIIFLHNSEIFPTPYADSTCSEVVKQLAVFGKGCLEFCCVRELIPSVCITNDWFTGLIPAYAKTGHFGPTFKGTTFLHIAHNLEPTYEGRLFPTPSEGACEHIHQLPRDCLVNPHWAPPAIINPSRCAILMSDQWATVSPSYKEDLLRQSPLADLLKQKPQPFAFPNGIPVEARIKKLDDAAPNHATAKKLIQKKYFGYSDFDDTVPLLSFVGRITTQKGVHLILDAAETLIIKSNFKINILVGGAVNMKEPYSAQCAHKMWHLKAKYPSCFWADPNQFFTDGSLVNRGTDFGLMPSIFEPGGIVQHEFFVGGTPVVAFKTGGLKDSVFEYNWDSETGNGYTFESHKVEDFIYACERALGTFKNKAKYLKLRQNAFDSKMDGDRVSRAWLSEFYRLRNKVFVDNDIIKASLLHMSTWSPESYKPMTSFEELFGIEKGSLTNFALEDIDFGAEEEREVFEEEKDGSKVRSHFETHVDDKLPHVFTMHNSGPRYRSVELCGTFDNWKTRHNMSFDNYTNQWFITLHLSRGKYLYKYVVNDSSWVVNDRELKEKDAQGNLNNSIVL